MHQRFGGTQRLYSQTGLERLANASVTIIGIGGVGSWVAEALARTAVGTLTLIDLDDICISNTNRQLPAVSSNIGKLKVEAMAERIKAINPSCQVNAIADFVNKNNLPEMLGGTAELTTSDYVVDAIDNARVKASLIYYCKRNKIKVITIGGAGAQKEPQKITVGDLSRTWQDPLSAKVRNELRRNHGFSKNPKRRFGIECVYSTEQLFYPNADGSVGHQKPIGETTGRLDCAQGLGASVVVTATFGMIAASRVINGIVNKD